MRSWEHVVNFAALMAIVAAAVWALLSPEKFAALLDQVLR